MLTHINKKSPKIFAYFLEYEENQFVAINDVYGSSGEYEEILEMVGLTVKNLILRSEAVLSRKKGH